MNPKHEITKIVLEANGLIADEKRIKQTIPIWWVNPRKKEKGGLRLTEQGFECLQHADIKCYEIRFDEPIFFTNKLAIWVDQNVDFIDKIDLEFCPEDGYSESGQGIVGLTTPGKYYVAVLAKINTYGEPRSGLDVNFLATPITITKNSTITCKKGSVTKKVTSSNPKCPAGFKKVG